MSKNIMISNVSNDKLLNGEMNENGIKINGELNKFSSYDCVYGVVDVDEHNVAQLDSNNKIKFDVYIRKGGQVFKSTPLEYSEDGQQKEDRPIDFMYPFSDIKKVLRTTYPENYNGSDSENIINNDVFLEQLSETEVVDMFSDTVNNENNTHFLFTRIPKFYYRTSFSYKDGIGKRIYEVISVDVYNSLDENTRKYFSLPSAFYTWEKDLPLAEKEHENNEFVFDFNDLNDYDFDSNDQFYFNTLLYTNPYMEGIQAVDIYNSSNQLILIDFSTNNTIRDFSTDGSLNTIIINIEVKTNKTITVTLAQDYSASKINIYRKKNNEFLYNCKQKDYLLVSTQPLGRDFSWMATGSKNNIFDLSSIKTEVDDSLNVFFDSHLMDVETWSGVICYLLRLYTGHFDLTDLVTKNTEFGVSDDILRQSTSNDGNKLLTFYKGKQLTPESLSSVFDLENQRIVLNSEDIKYATKCTIFSSKNLIDEKEEIIHYDNPNHFVYFKSLPITKNINLNEWKLKTESFTTKNSNNEDVSCYYEISISDYNNNYIDDIDELLIELKENCYVYFYNDFDETNLYYLMKTSTTTGICTYLSTRGSKLENSFDGYYPSYNGGDYEIKFHFVLKNNSTNESISDDMLFSDKTLQIQHYIYIIDAKIDVSSLLAQNASIDEVTIFDTKPSFLTEGLWFITNIFSLYKEENDDNEIKSLKHNDLSFNLEINNGDFTISRPQFDLIKDSDVSVYKDNNYLCFKYSLNTNTEHFFDDFLFYGFKEESTNNAIGDEEYFLSKTINLCLELTTDEFDEVDGNFKAVINFNCIIDNIDKINHKLYLSFDYNSSNIVYYFGENQYPLYVLGNIVFENIDIERDIEDQDIIWYLLRMPSTKNYFSVFDNRMSLISSAIENNKYFPIQLLNKNHMIGNKLSVMNLCNLFDPKENDYYPDLYFSYNNNAIINYREDVKTINENWFYLKHELKNDDFIEIKSLNFSLKKQQSVIVITTINLEINFNNIFCSSLNKTIKGLYVKKSMQDDFFYYKDENDVINRLSSDSLYFDANISNDDNYYTYDNGNYKKIVSTELRIRPSSVGSFNILRMLPITNLTLYRRNNHNTYDDAGSFDSDLYVFETKEFTYDFDGYIETQENRTQGVLCGNLLFKLTDPLDNIQYSLYVRTKNKTTKKHEKLLIFNKQTSKPNYSLEKFITNCFYCDNLENSTLFIEDNNIYYYKPETSYLELPSIIDDGSSSNICVETNLYTSDFFSKRTGQTDEKYNTNYQEVMSSFGSGYLQNNNNIYELKPSMYSCGFEPYFNYNYSDYGSGMLCTTFLKEASYNDYRDYICLFKKKMFLVF